MDPQIVEFAKKYFADVEGEEDISDAHLQKLEEMRADFGAADGDDAGDDDASDEPQADADNPEPDIDPEEFKSLRADFQEVRERLQEAEQKLADRPAATDDEKPIVERMEPVLDFNEKDLMTEAPEVLFPGDRDLQAKVADLQQFNDDVLFIAAITDQDPRVTKYWEHWVKMRGAFGEFVDKRAKWGKKNLAPGLGRDPDWEHSKFDALQMHYKASVTTSNLANWLPTFYSRQMIEKIRTSTGVFKLYPHITMTEASVDVPVEGSDPTVYKKSEGSTITESTVGDEVCQLDAVGVAARTTWSDEVNEDSLIPLLPYIRNKHARRMAEVLDFNAISGDESDTLGNSSNSSAPTAYNLWNGPHEFAYSHGTNVDADDAVPSGRNFIETKSNMGKYGRQATTIWIMAMQSYDMLRLSYDYDSSGYRNLIFNPDGAEGALLKDEVPTLFGLSIVQSEQVMTNYNDSGTYGTTTDRGIILCVCTEGWLTGTRRNVTVETDKDITNGKLEAVMTWRGDMAEVFSTSDYVAEMIYNIDWDW